MTSATSISSPTLKPTNFIISVSSPTLNPATIAPSVREPQASARLLAGTSAHRGVLSVIPDGKLSVASGARDNLPRQEVEFPSVKGRIRFYESSCKQPKTSELGVSCCGSILVDTFIDTGVLDLTPVLDPGHIRCLEVLSDCPSSESLCALLVWHLLNFLSRQKWNFHRHLPLLN